MDNEFYQHPHPRLAQGDIFLNIPSVSVRDTDLRFLRERDGTGGVKVADIFRVDGSDGRTPQGKAFNPDDERLYANLQMAPAMLLTHACEIDNSPKAMVLVALMRPLRSVGVEQHAPIKEGRNLRFLYVPPNDDPPLAESYVDFSRITSVRRQVLPDRPALSVSPLMLKAVYVGLVRYFTRSDVEPALLDSLVAKAIDEARAPA